MGNWTWIGQQVRQRREALGFTQKEAAEAAGVSEPTWGLLENGRQEGYKPLTLRGVCRALGWAGDSFDRMAAGKEPRLLQSARVNLSDLGAEDLAHLLEEAAARLRDAFGTAG
jgi:transcriptional regulator with XRE-family HTH domain